MTNTIETLLENIIQDECAGMLKSSIKIYGQEKVDALLAENPGLIEKNNNEVRARWEKSCSLMKTPSPERAKRLSRGMLHPSNKRSRKLWERIHAWRIANRS